jgi:peptidoglycan/xylan/chitin deacetylase (PgdA/CDA1 family)
VTFRDLAGQRVRLAAYTWAPGRGRRRARHPARERASDGWAVLTFDDGPDPQDTPVVLDALEAAGVRATFFVLGEQVAADPGLARELVARGHEIALHGERHFRHDQAGDRAAAEDVRRGLDAVVAALGAVPRFYRPPFGKFADGSARACAELELEPVYWSAWGLDWEDVPAARITREVARGLEDGAIVLLHDSARYARRATARPTAEAVGPLVELAAGRGLRVGTLGEALG